MKTLIALYLSICMMLGACAVPEQQPTTVVHCPIETVVQQLVIPEDASSQEAAQLYADYYGFNVEEYPERILKLYDKNVDAREFALNYPLEVNKEHTVDISEFEDVQGVPLFMQWDARWGYNEYGSAVGGLTACGPTCLAMVAYYYKQDPSMNPANMMEFALENNYYVQDRGTAWALMSEGCKEFGLSSEEVPLVETKIQQYLEKGVPIICVVRPGIFTDVGHFMVFVDYIDGKIKINDPNSYINSSQLWDYDDIKNEISNMWAMFED